MENALLQFLVCIKAVFETSTKAREGSPQALGSVCGRDVRGNQSEKNVTFKEREALKRQELKRLDSDKELTEGLYKKHSIKGTPEESKNKNRELEISISGGVRI